MEKHSVNVKDNLQNIREKIIIFLYNILVNNEIKARISKHMINSMWFNIAVSDIKKSEAFYSGIGFNINKNPETEAVMCAFEIGATVMIMVERREFENVTNTFAQPRKGEVLISISVDTDEKIDELVTLIPKLGGKVVKKAERVNGFYSAMFEDLDGHLINIISC